MRLDLNFFNNMSGINNMEIQRLVSSTQNYLNRSSKKSRRYRSSFTTEQINYLENEFKKFPYIGNVNRQELARVLNLPERAIKIWFQNRRMKEKKEASRDTDIVEERSNNNSMNSNNNNQLNNVHNLQSTNDQFHITTPLEIANNEVKHIGIPIEMKTSISGIKPLNYAAMNDFKEQEITTTTHSFEDRSAVTKNTFCEGPRTNIREVYEKSNITELTSLRNEKGDYLRNGRMNNKIQCSTLPQDLPEDLSQHCKPAAKSYVSKDTTESNVDARCLPVFVPNCYPTSYASGNVLWNSTNMGHIIPGRTTVPTPYHPGPYAVINQQSFRKSNCNCDCHLQFVPQVVTDQNQGQFIPIFTIPYTNPQSTLVIEKNKI